MGLDSCFVFYARLDHLQAKDKIDTATNKSFVCLFKWIFMKIDMRFMAQTHTQTPHMRVNMMTDIDVYCSCCGTSTRVEKKTKRIDRQ